jgi:hypothetical protein
MMTPIGVLGFALAGLGVYALYASGVVQNAMGAIGGFFRGVQADVQESFGAIVEAMTRGDIIAAANVLWATLQVIWQRGALALNQVWQPSVKFFLDVWNSAAGTAAAVFINVFATIETAFVSMVDAMKDAWSGLVIQFAQSMAGPLKEVGSFIAAITTKLKGGSDEDVISAIRGSRKGFDVAAAALAGGATEDVRARAEKRQKRLEEIEARRRGALGQNNAMVAAQFAGTDAAQAAALTKSEQALKDAQAQLAAARGVARNGSGRNGRLPNGQPAPSIPSVGNKFAAAGTFSAFSLSGLGGGRTELTNIATNTKQANKHLAQIASGVPFLPLVPLFAP